MKARVKLILLLLTLILALTACSSPQTPAESASDTRTLVDAAGRRVEIPVDVSRVVCVGVGALRYTCYMQAQELVVGVEDYETERSMSRLYNYVNYDLFKDLPVIGANGEPYAEAIISVDPQVIVMSALAAADPDEVQAKTGIPVVVVPGYDGLDADAYEIIRIMGELYGKQDRADALTAYLRELQTDLDDRTSAIPEEDRPTVYVGGVSFQGLHGFEGTEAGYSPFVLINADNLADRAGQTGAFNVDPEQVLVWDPDVIFVDFNGLPLINEDCASNPGYYNALTAVKEGKVYSQISFRSFATNLDTALADAYYAATVIYPEQFADVDPVKKTGEIFATLLGSDPYDDLKEAGYEFRPIQIGQ